MSTARLSELLGGLEELAYFHRALAQVLAGWSPKIADLDVKCACARHAYAHVELAQKLDAHLCSAGRSLPQKSIARTGWRAVMSALDRARSADAMLVAAYAVILRHLVERHYAVLSNLNAIYDAMLAHTLSPARAELEAEVTWARGVVSRRVSTDAALFAAEIEALWNSRSSGEPLAASESLWAPIDRVPRAARPAGMTRGIPGAMRAIPLDTVRDRAGIGLFLHNLVNGELTTLELASRSLYEHADMPAGFHLAMARQAADEARHAQMLAALAADYGITYGDHAIYTLTYDGYYAFDGCAPGSKRELCWRLLVRGTIDEGLALDDFAFQAKSREHLGQAELAELFRYLLADESFHVQSALRWSRYLCGDDEAAARAEREAANACVSRMLGRRRREFVEQHPERARAELEHRLAIEAADRAGDVRFERNVDVALRKQVGYADEDLQQLIGWGYAKPFEVEHVRG